MVTVLMVWLVGCSQPDQTLSDAEMLTRVSLDLRGVRPSIQELDLVSIKNWSLEQSVDRYLLDPNFPRLTAERWAPIFDTRRDETLFPAAEFGLPNEFRFA